MKLDQELIDAIRKVHDEHKYSLHQCACGHGQGHPLVYCPKCGKKMQKLWNISATELGKINVQSREWNTYGFASNIDKLTNNLLRNKYPRTASSTYFVELVSPVLDWQIIDKY